jgi:hypothetical protein
MPTKTVVVALLVDGKLVAAVSTTNAGKILADTFAKVDPWTRMNAGLPVARW